MGRPRDSAERFYERFGAGDVDGAAGLFSSDCIHVTPAGQQDATAWKAFAEAFRSALPDAHMEIVSVVEAGDAVAIEARFKGTHRGALVTRRARSLRAATPSTCRSPTSSGSVTTSSLSTACTGTRPR